MSNQYNRLLQQRRVQSMLRRRGLLQVAGRYSDPRTAHANFEQARDDMAAGRRGAYALLDAKEVPIGLATVLPKLPLRLQSNRLPHRISQKRGESQLVEDLRGPEVSAWTTEFTVPTSEVRQSTLFGAYHDLLEPVSGGADTTYAAAGCFLAGETVSTPWTIEPIGSPHWIHDALERASFRYRSEGHYDDGEATGLQLIRKARLYERVAEAWVPHETA
ncbi:MAG: hypothetical protein JWN38_373 [Candidatus Saccharibacteria bacterium]|nr:hypothetical protein [Candidatus Saccharibacteria bacterium]